MKKILVYLITIFVGLFFVYFIINYTYWNNTIYGLGDYLPFFWSFVLAAILTTITAIYVETSEIKTIFYSTVIFLSVISFSFYSLKIGKKQTASCINKVKIAIDKYYEDHNKYPNKLSDLEKEGYLKNLSKPIFLYPNGRYHLSISGDNDSYSIELGREYALFWVYANKNSDTPSFYFDN